MAVILRWLRRLLYRSGAPMTVTIPSGFQEGDAISRPDGPYEWVGGEWRPLRTEVTDWNQRAWARLREQRPEWFA